MNGEIFWLFKGGGIIAVNYEARAFGVTRQMRGDAAKGQFISQGNFGVQIYQKADKIFSMISALASKMGEIKEIKHKLILVIWRG